MTDYTVQTEYVSAEFGWAVYPGDVLVDGDIEPDLMAQLVASGVVVPEGGVAPAVAELPAEEEDAPSTSSRKSKKD